MRVCPYKLKGTSRQRSGKGAIRKRFPLQKPRWEKTKLTIRYLYHETIVSRMGSYFPNRWPLSYLNLTKNMKTYIRRQQHKKFLNTKTETGRYKKPKVPLNNRICNLCTDNVIEDEIHFLLCCDFYSDIRRPLLAKAQWCYSDFQNMSMQDKFVFLMNYINMQYILSSTLLQMFSRRKRML